MFPQVVPEPRPQGAFVQDVLGVHLGQAEGFLFVPGPPGGVENPSFLTWPPFFLGEVAAQDVADRPLRDPQGVGDPPPSPQPRSLFNSSTCSSTSSGERRGGTFRPPGPVAKTGFTFLPVPSHPLSHGIAGDKEPSGRLPDARTFPVHCHDLEPQHELPLLGRQGLKLW